MPILLGQVAVIVLILTIGTFTNRLETIRENRPDFESPGIYHRSRGSLGTKRQAVKRLTAPRGRKKKCDPVRGHTSETLGSMEGVKRATGDG